MPRLLGAPVTAGLYIDPNFPGSQGAMWARWNPVEIVGERFHEGRHQVHTRFVVYEDGLHTIWLPSGDSFSEAGPVARELLRGGR